MSRAAVPLIENLDRLCEATKTFDTTMKQEPQDVNAGRAPFLCLITTSNGL